MTNNTLKLMNYNNSFRRTIINVATDRLQNKEYIHNWFDADNFFNTTYITGLLRNKYFITKDDFIDSIIFSVKEITDTEILTVSGPLNTLDEAKQWVKENDTQ